MTTEELKQYQRDQREKCVQAILDSPAKKKLIVAGAGTGKTYTFGRLIERRKSGNNLAMTFIRKLVMDMDTALKGNAEVKTFHAYCKKTLHGEHGAFELIGFLPALVHKDAMLLNKPLGNFAAKFQMLEERSPEMDFYLERSDYYNAVGFDDAVYRLLKEIQTTPAILPEFNQIVIDEFQDFNPMEVAFIEELSKRGDILIVGDDDQAVYNDRSASPAHLRKLYASSEFEKFELPFCSRCTEVVVEAAKGLIKTATQCGYLKGRIPKNYECFLDDKASDSERYPKIIIANCTTGKNVPKYIHLEIANIHPSDIAESHVEGKDYPTVLIVGKAHYLREIEKQLRRSHPQIAYTPSSREAYGIADAYRNLIPNEKSNLGWRILVELFLDQATQHKVIEDSLGGRPMVDLIPSGFVAQQMRVIELARSVRSKSSSAEDIESELRDLIGDLTDPVLNFLSEAERPVPAIDKKLPIILLTSFKGCKGLSAGHVFIVGVHDGCMPKDNRHVDDVEISQFIVALTRTRKQCHILSNDWLVAPRGKKGWIPRFETSLFVDWIPKELVENRGQLRAQDLK
jgi:superfamily I DNA/RNA helicase